MALKASCTFCKKTFSAPEEYQGKKVECPSCGRRSVLRTEAELHAAAEQEQELRRKRQDDREKLALIERMEARGRKGSGKPYYEEFQTGVEGVRHFNPREVSRYIGFRNLSDLLVLGAYVELLLVAVGVGSIVYLKLDGTIGSVPLLIALIIVWLVIGIALYLLLKYLGELSFLLADVGDQQNDIVQLLLDIRDNTDGRDG
jgi:uncharacterized Zn finger protein (UPF0148 family)